MKITVIGAGNVGASCAEKLAKSAQVTEVVLLHTRACIAKGKSLDIIQSACLYPDSIRLICGVDKEAYGETADSQIIILTAGARVSPGMSREDVLSINAEIVISCVEETIKYSPQAKIIVVSNPLDVMSYAAYRTVLKKGKSAEWASKNILGMAGVLDTARYRFAIANALGCPPSEVQSLVIGAHNPTMVPLIRYTRVSGIPLSELLPFEKMRSIEEYVKNIGVKMIEQSNHSAYYAPASALVRMVEAIVKDSKCILPCCAWLQGEYGLKEVYLGVPAILGSGGVERVIELNLNREERRLLHLAAENVKTGMKNLERIHAFL